MAKLYSFGFIELDHMLNKLANIPQGTKNSMMRAAAEEFKDHTEKTAGRMIVPGSARNKKSERTLGSYVTGYTKNNIVIKKQGDAMYVTWEGTVRHAKGVKANEVAFLTEYGVPGRGIPARPFIAQAVKEGFDDAYDAAMDELDEFLDNL